MVTANFNTSLMVGQTGNTLTCDVSGANKLNPMITWNKNGSGWVQVDNSTIRQLSPLQLSHAGNYSCGISSTLINYPVTAQRNQSVIIRSE